MDASLPGSMARSCLSVIEPLWGRAAGALTLQERTVDAALPGSMPRCSLGTIDRTSGSAMSHQRQARSPAEEESKQAGRRT